MGKFINPFTDCGFKKIFGQEITKDLLIDFFNDLLEGERFITDLTFLNTAQIPELETTQGKKGSEWQSDIKAVYGVFFMNFVFDKLEQIASVASFSQQELERL